MLLFKMLKKILTVCLIAFNYVNAGSTPFTTEREDAEIFHCRKTPTNSCVTIIFRQQNSVQIVGVYAQELSFVKSIIDQDFNSFCKALGNAGFAFESSILKLCKGIRYTIDNKGWLTAHIKKTAPFFLN